MFTWTDPEVHKGASETITLKGTYRATHISKRFTCGPQESNTVSGAIHLSKPDIYQSCMEIENPSISFPRPPACWNFYTLFPQYGSSYLRVVSISMPTAKGGVTYSARIVILGGIQPYRFVHCQVICHFLLD